jgi:uncharacterized protein (DUF2225 family)
MYLAEVGVKCTNCGSHFNSVQFAIFIETTKRTSELRQDFGHPKAHMELHEVCTCPTCGKSDWMTAFPPTSQKANLRQANVPPHLQYRNAAVTAEREGKNNFQVGMFYLYAAWCAEDAGAFPQAREYRYLATDAFSKSLVDQSCPVNQRAEIEYLIGELLRRAGDFKGAQEHLRSVVTRLPAKFALMARKIMRLAELGKSDVVPFDL